MKLTRFRVKNFRSVVDSGWIEVNDVTALIGINESGKSNLLLALWKLKPTNEGEIQPTSDYPKTLFGEIRKDPGKYAFIVAEFDTEGLKESLARKTGIPSDDAARVRVTRFFDGSRRVEFPCYQQETTVERSWLIDRLSHYAGQIESGKELNKESGLKNDLMEGLCRIKSNPLEDKVDAESLTLTIDEIKGLVPEESAKTSAIVPLVHQLAEELAECIKRIKRPPPGECDEVEETILNAMPAFVYYSHYGNLDSEIYLPHVVDNLKRKDLGPKDEAKVRTLRVLFGFVGLAPREILTLGESDESNLTEGVIEEISDKKKERRNLFQGAGATLTERFRAWWRQGNYRFRFDADGDHFYIWVSDDRRPTEVELQGRSSGLQWFLSFYLVFLFEAEGKHSGVVLLLDEPGMSLHPQAQRFLSDFFDNLSGTNQILYTSHSPFLVDHDRLDRARKVYVAEDGSTKVTSDLRHSEGNDEQAGAAYAVHSALNLTVGESILVGCRPILVEGVSDQHYLTAVKSWLAASGKIKPSRELVFVPSGGAKNVRVVASILTGRDGSPPTVLLDADGPGRRTKESLTAANALYAGHEEHVLSIDFFVNDVQENAEVEDLFPPSMLAEEIDRIVRETDVRLTDVIKAEIPFVGQVESWAKEQSATLPTHWKVELARRVKKRMVDLGSDLIDEAVDERWVRLFDAFER